MERLATLMHLYGALLLNSLKTAFKHKALRYQLDSRQSIYLSFTSKANAVYNSLRHSLTAKMGNSFCWRVCRCWSTIITTSGNESTYTQLWRQLSRNCSSSGSGTTSSSRSGCGLWSVRGKTRWLKLLRQVFRYPTRYLTQTILATSTASSSSPS